MIIRRFLGFMALTPRPTLRTSSSLSNTEVTVIRYCSKKQARLIHVEHVARMLIPIEFEPKLEEARVLNEAKQQSVVNFRASDSWCYVGGGALT